MITLVSFLFLSFGILLSDGCGKRPFSARVVNGVNAAPHSWPWQVSLRRNGKYHTCGGSLIRPDWVVTAAHCVYRNLNPSGYTVVVGAHRRKGITDVQQTLNVKSVHVHSGFSIKHLKHDIALLQLDPPADLSDKISTICLPQKAPELNSKCYITGWGKVSGWGPSADQLKQAKLPLRSDKECKEKYSSAYDGRIHLCAGEGRVGASGGCQGDSGGPLACEFGSTWYLHGAVSFGMTRCTTAYYTVFTRITNYIAWIFEKIGEDESGVHTSAPLPLTPVGSTPSEMTEPPQPTRDPGCKDKLSQCEGNEYFCNLMPSFKRDCPKTCKSC